eukprot:COSAG01_NODE_12546_length_1722_cov_2.075786_1_plen_391_part_00
MGVSPPLPHLLTYYVTQFSRVVQCTAAGKNKLGYALMDLAARAAGGGGGTPQPPDDAPGFPDGAADGGGSSRPAKRARVDDGGGVSASAAASAAATTATCGNGFGGGGGGGSAIASTLAPTPLPATVDYVGFYKRKVPNTDRKFKSFCNLYKSPYIVPADGDGNAIALLPRIRGKRFQTVEGGFQLLKFDPTKLTEDDIELFAENTGAVAFFLGSSQASMFTANMYKKSTYTSPPAVQTYLLMLFCLLLSLSFPGDHLMMITAHPPPPLSLNGLIRHCCLRVCVRACSRQRTGNPELHAKMLAWKARNVPLRPDWDVVKVGVMQDFMTYKYTQNKKLGALLLSTGNKLIVERSPTDATWGDGNQQKPELGPGTNLAGQLLVKIRDSIRRK